MDARKPVLLSWSGGKDSALALHALRDDPRYAVVGLLTTVAGEFERVSHHGVRTELLERQAAAAGLPLRVVRLPPGEVAMAEYEALMGDAMARCRAEGIGHVAFGDLFLAELRAYRERKLALAGMEGVFPLWGGDTAALLRRFVALGFEGRLACVDGRVLGREFAGRALDASLAAALPPGVDPCGENGEYHSFVTAGPVFARPVPVTVGEVVERDVRWFADLLPVEAAADDAHPSAARPVVQRKRAARPKDVAGAEPERSHAGPFHPEPQGALTMTHPRFLTLVGIVLAAAALRLMPHWPNFTPIAAMALFGGAHFASRRIALAVPLAAMLLSDALLGFHASMGFVYGAFVVIVGLGLLLRERRTPLWVGGAALGASALFFAVTNFGAWLVGGLYPLTGAGLMAAYAAGIPFFANTVAGDLLYTGVLFGGFALAERTLPALREVSGALPAAG